MNVNFILTSGDLNPGYRRAIKSAAVHGAPIVLWCAARVPPDVKGLDVQLEHVEIPSWLVGQQAHIFDVLAYQLAYEHGGAFFGLDTISVRPALDLFNYCRPECEVIVSTDWAIGDPNCGQHDGMLHPYNNNFIAKKGSDMAGMLAEEAKRVITRDTEDWGCTGPLLLTRFVQAYPNLIAGAPYPALCGWSPGYVWRFYLGLEAPSPETRVIHLCRTAYQSLWDGRYADWNAENPAYAAERTTLNDHLIYGPDAASTKQAG